MEYEEKVPDEKLQAALTKDERQAKSQAEPHAELQGEGLRNQSGIADSDSAVSPPDDVSGSKLHSVEDEDMVLLAQQGNSDAEEYLLNKYKNCVRSKARSYFLIGADYEDLIQEGMFGLFKAIRDFQPDKLTSFRAFSEICITRQIITAVKTATRMKHIPLNSYVSLNKPVFDGESDRTLMDVLEGNDHQNPEDLIIGSEDVLSIQEEAKKVLSKFEQKVFFHYMDGKSYLDIAKLLQKPPKSIDNALQRVKHKMEKAIQEKKQNENL